jgi:hypothetical protein
MTDDTVSTRTVSEYRDASGRLVFWYRQSAATQAMAPTHVEERVYYRGGQVWLADRRERPVADTVWFEEHTSRKLSFAAPSVGELWPAFGSTDGSRCAELRAVFEGREKAARAAGSAALKKRFGAWVSLEEPPTWLW